MTSPMKEFTKLLHSVLLTECNSRWASGDDIRFAMAELIDPNGPISGKVGKLEPVQIIFNQGTFHNYLIGLVHLGELKQTQVMGVPKFMLTELGVQWAWMETLT